MDIWSSVVNTPSWAKDLCWYYFAVAALMAVYGLWALIHLFTTVAKKGVSVWPLAIGVILSVGVTVILALLQFWICRGALGAAAKEKFAVQCNSKEDCLAVTGNPQGATCDCLKRGSTGHCGGCTMQNNMQPQASFGAQFDPLVPIA
jgi:hypothetical protein